MARCALPSPPASSSQTPHPTLQAVQQRLITELPTLFESSQPDYSIYAPDVQFEDPLNRFRGTARYRSNINLLTNSPLFSAASFALHSTAILPSDPPTVRTRWTLTLCFQALPWRPSPAFTGQSDYVVDLTSGLVTRHVDYWDSLSDSAQPYFSPPALLDFITQCATNPVATHSLPPFDLLRRTPHFEIWRFIDRALLALSDHASVWSILSTDVPPREGAVAVESVAVVRMSDSSPSQRDVSLVVDNLREKLSNVPYAVPTDRAYCVNVPTPNGRSQHFVWLILSHAGAPVDL